VNDETTHLVKREDAMQSYTLNVVTDCRASVTMRQKGNGMVVEIDPELIWDRDGLLKLSAARLRVQPGCCASS